MVEIVLLGGLAIIIFGPEKLPELARKAARGQLREELGPEFDNFSLADLNPKTLVAKHLLSGEEVADFREMRDDALATGQLVKDAVGEASGSTSGVPSGAGAPVAAAPRSVPFDPEAT